MSYRIISLLLVMVMAGCSFNPAAPPNSPGVPATAPTAQPQPQPTGQAPAAEAGPALPENTLPPVITLAPPLSNDTGGPGEVVPLTTASVAAASLATASLAPVTLAPATLAPATLAPIPTATPEPTQNALAHPMTIDSLRARSYPGSAITLERELERGSNYRRFYASYLSDGLTIYALLTIPDGEAPAGGFPAIIFNHGYIPPAVYRTTERYVAYVDWLARSGYVVFRIDYRGHDQSEGEASGAYGSPGYTIDVLNALASLSQFPQVNPEKIGMWGHSMGGFLTLRAMVVARESGAGDIKAGVIWAGVVVSYPDMLRLWRRGAGPTPTPPAGVRRWRAEWQQLYGTPEENPAFWSSVSANHYLADLSGPIQLHHATADEDVPVVFSEILAQELSAAGQTGELYIYQGDNHNLSSSFAAAMTRTIAFFDQQLK